MSNFSAFFSRPPFGINLIAVFLSWTLWTTMSFIYLFMLSLLKVTNASVSVHCFPSRPSFILHLQFTCNVHFTIFIISITRIIIWQPEAITSESNGFQIRYYFVDILGLGGGVWYAAICSLRELCGQITSTPTAERRSMTFFILLSISLPLLACKDAKVAFSDVLTCAKFRSLLWTLGLTGWLWEVYCMYSTPTLPQSLICASDETTRLL